MAFNGIGGYLNKPGEIPFEFVVAYFLLMPILIFALAKRNGSLKSFKTVDWVYIGIGAAAATAWEFFVGPILDRAIPSSLSSYVNFDFWGRMFIVFAVASLVRKPGVGITSLFVFDVLADLFHYGFGGQPLYFIYESLTYGAFVDLVIAITGGHIFGLGLTRHQAALGALEGGIIGFLWSLPDPILYEAFLKPFIYGAVVNWQKVIFDLAASIPGTTIVGVLGGFSSNRVGKTAQV